MAQGLRGLNILVTGATGFVGRYVSEKLTAEGAKVYATTRQSYSGDTAISWIDISMNVQDNLDTFFAETPIDAVVHIAGCINAKPDIISAANEGFTLDLLNAMQNSQNAPAFYFLSSVSAITEAGNYGISKRQCERFIADHAPARWAVLRSSLIHGPLDQKNVGMLIRAARYWPLIPVIGGAGVKLQPLYVDDVAKAFIALIGGQGKDQGIYTIAGPRQERLLDMIKAIQAQIKRKVPLMPIPLYPIKLTISIFDALLPFLKLPVQQVKALSNHPMYEYEDAVRDLDFKPRFFAGTLKDYL